MPGPTGVSESGAAGLPDSYLDASACMALLGALYPLTPSLLYFQLEAFLQAAGPLPEVLASDSDVVAVYNRSTGQADLAWRRRPRAKSVELPEPAAVHVHVRIDGSHNISRVVSVPLAALVKGGNDLTGFAGFVHSITFLDTTPSQQPIEEWRLVDVAQGADGWVARMDDFEREVRTGGNRKFKEVWRRYAGAAGIQLHSELRVTGLSEADVLDWEEAEVDRALKSRQSLNPLPGGLKGMRLLAEKGCKVTGLADRNAAIGKWRHEVLTAAPTEDETEKEERRGLRVPHLLAPWASADLDLLMPSNSRHPTPALVTEVRALALSGITPVEITRQIPVDLATVTRILSAVPRQ